MATKQLYHLQIKTLELAEDIQPFDFRLVLKTKQNKQQIDGPIIYVQNFQCEKDFPWNFTFSSSQIVINFVQLSKEQKKKIVKGACELQLHGDEDDQETIINAIRTNKEICRLIYSCELSNDQKNPEAQPNRSKENNIRPSDNNSSGPKSRRAHTQEQYEQLTKQLNEIKKTMAKILDRSDFQQKMYSGILDETELNGGNSNRDNIIQEVEEQESEKVDLSKLLDQSPESLKWYQQKFGKQKPSTTAKSFQNSSQPVQNFQPSLEYSKDFSLERDSFLISELSFLGDAKPKQIQFRQKEKEEPALKIICPEKYGYLWEKPIMVPQMKLIYMTVIDADTEKKHYTCLEFNDPKNIHAALFDEKGQPTTLLTVKYKVLGSQEVQTNDVLSTMEEAAQKQEESEKNDEEQQFYQEEDSQLMGNTQNAKTQTPRAYLAPSLFEKTPIAHGSPFIYRVPGKIRSFRKADSPRDKIMEEEEESKHDEISRFPESATESSDQMQKYQFQLRSRRKPSDIRQTKYSHLFHDNREQLRPKVEDMEKGRQFQFISNSVNVNFIPKLRVHSTENVKRKNSGNNFEDDLEMSNIQSDQSGITPNVSFKIDNISIKLLQNTDPFSGKFLKLQIKEKQPFVTETITLSKNLTWKGKGYIFQKVPIFSELVISVYTEQDDGPILEGSTRICLALLNLEETSKIIFYHDYVRDSEMKHIGELILGYESLSGKSKNRNQHKKVLTEVDAPRRSKIKRRVKKSNGSEKSYPLNQVQNKKSKPIGLNSSQAKSVVGSSSAIRSKKYTGGNIVIGRSSRFKGGTFRSGDSDVPGPGNYDYPSMFRKYEA